MVQGRSTRTSRMHVAALVVALIALLVSPTYASSDACAVPMSDASREDCGFVGISATQCTQRGCCWAPAESRDTFTGSEQPPWCFYPALTYSLETHSFLETVNSGALSGVLRRNDDGIIRGPRANSSEALLTVDVVLEDVDYAHMRIVGTSNEAKTAWEVPSWMVNRPKFESKVSVQDAQYTISYTNDAYFKLQVIRKADQKVVLETMPQIVVAPDFVELGVTREPEDRLFGIGESSGLKHAVQPGVRTLWAADIPSAVMGSNLYSSFPIFTQLDAKTGKTHGGLLFNSHGMDVAIESNVTTFQTLGGAIDYYAFSGGQSDGIVQSYTRVVGRPMMIPYWTLGFHNCRWGYKSVKEVETVVQSYVDAGIPLETQWTDIDYMDAYKDFTTSPTTFNSTELRSFIDTLHSNDRKFIQILDPGIKVQPGYFAYDEGIKQNTFIKDVSGGDYIGQVWPGPTHFPDFLSPNITGYWNTLFKNYLDSIPIDGVWIDMNEASNFCNNDGKGQACKLSSKCDNNSNVFNCCLDCSLVDPSNSLDFPRFNIHNRQGTGALSARTIPVSATLHGNVTSYAAHNVYGMSEQVATRAALKAYSPAKRPFILSRSAFPGSGYHAAKWTGDNAATWADMRSSIISLMDFNMFGIPMFGADICGFQLDTTEELCARWASLGSFYPFSRNHNTIGAKSQEYYLWESVTASAKNALSMRYQMLPYLYTLFFEAHVSGTTVMRPLWSNYGTDTMTHDIDDQFMLGEAVMVSPVLDKGETTVMAYFPKNTWYDFKARSFFLDSAGETRTLPAPITEINVHIAGGNVMALQDSAMTTVAAKNTPFTLLAALDAQGKADGYVFSDDGEQPDINDFDFVAYNVQMDSNGSGTFTATVKHSTYKTVSNVNTVQVLGVPGMLSAPVHIQINGNVVDASQHVSFDDKAGSLLFHDLEAFSLSLTSDFTLEWS